MPPPPTMPPKTALPPPPPPPAPMVPSKGSAPAPVPPFGKKLGLRKPDTKLKRSPEMSKLYQSLKKKMEGANQGGLNREAKSSLREGRSGLTGDSNGGKKGMADTLEEMKKKSSYYQQIEKDVTQHAKSIVEMRAAITAFQTKDMTELLKFHKYVESQLEDLIDEGQVLARFEDFPAKKLETLRTAAALYLKLDAVVTNLKIWKVVAPLSQLLDRIEKYFNKIKGEVEAWERTKDEESKKFKAHDINFNFDIILRIKESMVDISSNCVELALQERENMLGGEKGGSETESATTQLLWRTFRFAFRVYSFAGGQDDRAERLTRELAFQIDSTLQHQ